MAVVGVLSTGLLHEELVRRAPERATRLELRTVVENFDLSDPAETADDTLLVTNAIVDSTGMLEVIAFLEGQFGITSPTTR